MYGNQHHKDGTVKRSHHKDGRRSRSQSQDTRGTMSTTSQHRVWRRSDSQVRTHQRVMSPGPGGTKNKVWSSSEGVTPPGTGVLKHKMWRSASEDKTHQVVGPPESGASQHRRGRSASKDRPSAPNAHEGRVTVAVVVKQLAQLYGGYVDAKKAAEMVQVCTPQFLQQLEAFVRSAEPDTTFLSDLATFCLSSLTCLPSSVCVQFRGTLLASLRLVEQSGNTALSDRFARLQEKLAVHVQKTRELDAGVAKLNFRSIPVLPVQADAFLCSLYGADVSVSSADQRYLSTLFFSLYEAFIGRVRDGIRSFRDAESASLRLPSYVCFYRGVRFVSPVLVGERLCLATSLAPVGRISAGSLVCFSCNGFRSLLFATVDRADDQLVVRLNGEVRITRQLFEQEYVMADSGLRAEPFVHVLLTLQQLQAVPLRKFLVDGATVLGRNNFMAEPGSAIGNLDSWQREAVTKAFTQELCLVLGPPGSGKTHVACAVARNSRFPVLVLCESHSGLDVIRRCVAPLTFARLSDRSRHHENQQTRRLRLRKDSVLLDIRKMELDFALLARRDGVVALSSLREGGAVSDAHFRSFLRQPDTASVFYSWLVDEAAGPPDARSATHDRVPFTGVGNNVVSSPLSALEPSLKWAESLVNVEKKRSEVNTKIGRLQEQWGRGEDVTEEVHVQKELYRSLAFKLKRLRTRLTKTWPSEVLRACPDVWQLRPSERWGLYFAWVAALRIQLLDNLSRLQAQLTVLDRNLELAEQLIDLEIAQQAAVVGATAGEATNLRSLLEKLAPKTVIVDEATNITEAQLVTCLPQSCEHIVLLGDMRPVQDAASCQEDQLVHLHSLLHKLVERKMAVSELKSQHRMQPHVANLIMLALYPGLEGHSSVTKTCKVKGVDQNIFFITHVHLADKVGNVSDYRNLYEANFLLALCHHLLLQSYNAQDIIILTTYPSQRDYLQQVHTDKLTPVSSAEDFLQIPEGGCTLPCNYMLKCGHTCHKQCHISDRQHNSYHCKQHKQNASSCQHKVEPGG